MVREPMRLVLVLSFVLASAVVACSSSTAPSGEEASATTAEAGRSPDFATCTAALRPASDKVTAAIAASTGCSADADCTTIELAASCFDSCTRAVAKAGVAAIEQVKTDVSNNECHPFFDAGCKLEAPPCEAPATPTCSAGHCQ